MKHRSGAPNLAILVWALALLGVASDARAQESASYRLAEATFNAGGRPAAGGTPSSASYRVSLEAIGGAIAHLGAAGASYVADGGFAPPYRPPTEVQGVVFLDGDTLDWSGEPSTGAYRVYRGAAAQLGGPTGDCFADDVTATTMDDADEPDPGDAFLYLVTAVNRLREEGTPGVASSGVERLLASTCP